MEATFYAVFNAKGFVRSTTGRGPGGNGRGAQPSLGPGERAIRMKVSIPDVAFKPEGIATATVTVRPEDVLNPPPAPVVAVLPQVPGAPPSP